MTSYSIYSGDNIVASELTLQNALIFIEALFSAYKEPTNLGLVLVRTVKENPTVVEENKEV